MKLALAVWKGRISPVFDVSGKIIVLDIESSSVVRMTEETIACDNPVRRVCRLAELDVQTLICGAISRALGNMLDAYGIRTISFIAGEVGEVTDAYLAGNLPNPALSMPGCCKHRWGAVQEEPRATKQFGNKEQSRAQREDNNMPKNDGTGPRGQGPGTGRGQGRCGGGQGKQRFGGGNSRKQGQNTRSGQSRGRGQDSDSETDRKK